MIFNVQAFSVLLTKQERIVPPSQQAPLASWYFEQLEANAELKMQDLSSWQSLRQLVPRCRPDWLASVGAEGQAIIDAYNKM